MSVTELLNAVNTLQAHSPHCTLRKLPTTGNLGIFDADDQIGWVDLQTGEVWYETDSQSS